MSKKWPTAAKCETCLPKGPAGSKGFFNPQKGLENVVVFVRLICKGSRCYSRTNDIT